MMISFLQTTSVLLAWSLGITAAPTTKTTATCEKAAFFLAGDSTTARQSAGGGGWGNGFLTTLKNGSFGMNYGHNGATTVSFRNGGDWAKVLAKVNQSLALDYKPFVTIQFGHNDQKPAANINITSFMGNLKQMALDVQVAGGTPILVTSLTRRNFNTTTNLVIEDLVPQVNATIEVAKSMGINYIDLNAASMKYVNEIGANASWTYNLITTDHTHLNSYGSMVFGNIASKLIEKSLRYGREFATPNKTITSAVEHGKYIFPSLPATNWTDSTAPVGFSF